jgi:TRAP-type C4-dicarboxylate transport system substrate-binding protein
MKSLSTRVSPSRLAPLLAAVCLGAAAPMAAQAQFQERTLRFAIQVPKEHPMAIGGAKMAACTVEKSGGKLRLQLFHDSEIGRAHV